EAREEFRLALETILRECEPRFKTVTVKLLDSAEPLDRTLRFRIDALMYADPAPEELVFDSTLEALTGAFKIERAGRRAISCCPITTGSFPTCVVLVPSSRKPTPRLPAASAWA